MFKESFLLKFGDSMIYELPSIFKFVKIFLSTGENQTFKIEKHEKLAKSFIINFGNFNIMIDSNDNDKVDSIFMPNNKVKFIEFLTTEDSTKHYEDQTFKKPLFSSSSLIYNKKPKFSSSSSTFNNEPTLSSRYNNAPKSYSSSSTDYNEPPCTPFVNPYDPKEKEVLQLKEKYKVLSHFKQGKPYILQHLCSKCWLSRHPLMEGLDFIDVELLQFDSKSDMQHYINSVYRPFALKQLQKGTEYTKCTYQLSDSSTGGKGFFYILDLERQASKKEPWKHFETCLFTRDGYYYPVKDAKEAYKIYCLQNKYNQNHDYVYSDEELDDYISLMKFFIVFNDCNKN